MFIVLITASTVEGDDSNSYINNHFGDDNIASTVQLTEKVAYQLEPISGAADSHLLTKKSQEMGNDISRILQEMDSELLMDIRGTNSSVTSEKPVDLQSHLVQTVHSNGVETISVEKQAESDLCKVCGDMASKHTYYGGRSCQSCRQFFRRSVILLHRQVQNCIFEEFFLNLHLYITM